MNTLVITEEFNEDTLSTEFKKLYDAYKAFVVERPFKTIKHLRKTDPTTFCEKCAELAKRVKYIMFRKDRLQFEIRVTVGQGWNKKRVYLGTTPDFDEAIVSLREYLKTYNEINASNN